MFDAVWVEDAEGQSIVWINLLWILVHLCFFLNSLELAEQIDRRVLYRVLFAAFLCIIGLFLDDVAEDGVVDGEAVDVVELFD